MMFRARLATPEFGPGHESLDVRLFGEQEIPWDRLAFPVVQRTLERYYNDLRKQHFPVHVEDIIRHPHRQP
jgi:hypothetical protein